MIKTFHCDIRLMFGDKGMESVVLTHRCQKPMAAIGEATVSYDTETKNIGISLTHPNDRFVRKEGFKRASSRCETLNQEGWKSAFNGPAKVNRFGIPLNLRKMAKNFVEGLDK